MDAAPKDGSPFLLGTKSGGVMLESWHWCSEQNDFAGVYSKLKFTTLQYGAPNETFLCATVPAT